jgi:hypothetical protein
VSGDLTLPSKWGCDNNGTLKTTKRTIYISNVHGIEMGPEKKPTREWATMVL